MNRLLVAVLAAGGVVMAVTVWHTLPRTKSAAAIDPSKYKYMHCPECMRESLYSSSAADTPCLRCDKKMVPTVESIKAQAGRANPWRRMAALLLTEAVFILGVIVYILYNPSPPPEEEEYYVYCPNKRCGRKMAYPARRAGAKVRCPLCKTAFTNPSVPTDARRQESECHG